MCCFNKNETPVLVEAKKQNQNQFHNNFAKGHTKAPLKKKNLLVLLIQCHFSLLVMLKVLFSKCHGLFD